MIAFVAAALVLGQAAPVYKINRKCDTQEGVTLVSLKQEKTATVLSFNFLNSGTESRLVRTAPPGHKEAFFIIDPTTKKKYDLLDIEGIAVTPSATSVAAKAKITFKLTFERIPNSLRRFHLIEGEVEPAGDGTIEAPVSWRWIGVKY